MLPSREYRVHIHLLQTSHPQLRQKQGWIKSYPPLPIFSRISQLVISQQRSTQSRRKEVSWKGDNGLHTLAVLSFNKNYILSNNSVKNNPSDRISNELQIASQNRNEKPYSFLPSLSSNKQRPTQFGQSPHGKIGQTKLMLHIHIQIPLPDREEKNATLTM